LKNQREGLQLRRLRPSFQILNRFLDLLPLAPPHRTGHRHPALNLLNRHDVVELDRERVQEVEGEERKSCFAVLF
jgi:hypothetical protein